jgi:EpsI family protein
LEPVYIQALKMNDYFLADYVRTGAPPVNFYVAWYDSQRAGQSAHSPRSCIPGGGWRIDSLTQAELVDVPGPDGLLRVNRALVTFGGQQQIVYYWFQQRGRVITNEYLVKWYLFRDALTRNRTDGALVRLTTPVTDDEGISAADARLSAFAAAAVPRLHTYIPE